MISWKHAFAVTLLAAPLIGCADPYYNNRYGYNNNTRAEQRLENTYDRAASDGYISPEERYRLDRQQQRVNDTRYRGY